jgi:hypothetical protein
VITTLFVALITLQHYAPKPIDWSVTCNVNSKSPYGCYVLNDLFDTLFPNQAVEQTNEGFYVSLDSTWTELQNLIVITPNFDPDRYDFGALLKFVDRGNDLFVSSSEFGKLFLDSLGIKLSSSIIDTSVFRMGDEVLYLLNQELKCDSGFHFNKKMQLVSISAFDTLNSLKLGTNRKRELNFICMQYGLGRIYLHTQPLVFTNYHLLYGNIEYASKALSYLPIRRTIWDNYYKPDRFINDSPTRYILSQPPLRSAYYLLLLTLILYMTIESKRRQRVVPVVNPIENKSLQFVKTIGGLYYKQRNNADLAKKKIIYFKEFLREHYHLSTVSATDDCIALLVAKSGVSEKLVGQILYWIQYYETAQSVADAGLIELNHNIELFYEQCL